ncbi:hypothetical protein [Hyphomicrobium sp. MC8b]|uniref:hypothetical protein n=1 Tax=Hyphomicrobium sp. MC8b TaxID=300273 RepID=UPI003918ABC9
MTAHQSKYVVAMYDPASPYALGIAGLVSKDSGQIVIASTSDRLAIDKSLYRGCANVCCLKAPGNTPQTQREYFKKIGKRFGSIDALIIEAVPSHSAAIGIDETIRTALKKMLDALTAMLPFAASKIQMIVIGPDYLFPIAQAVLKIWLRIERARTGVSLALLQLTVVFSSKSADEPDNIATTLIQINDAARAGSKIAPAQSCGCGEMSKGRQPQRDFQLITL